MQNKNIKNNKKTAKLFYKILSFILVIISVMAASVVLYFEVLPFKYLIILLVLLTLMVFGVSYKLNKKTNLFTKLVLSLISFILILFECFGMFYAFGTMDFLNKIFDTGYRVETYNVYVLKDSNSNKLDDLKNKTISVYESDTDNYKKALEKLNNKVTFTKEIVDSIPNGVDKLLTKETEAFFVSESLMKIYKEDHEEEYSKLKVLESVDILSKSKTNFKTVDVKNDSFVVYLSGSDLTGSINKVSRSDVNLLAVVNPSKGKILLINTPRDFYVNLASKNALDKLTHAGIYGIDESAHTLGNFYNVDINYYARVNFTSFVKLIDAFGSIDVDSKFAFSYDGYSFRKGKNTLNGKAALAFSRGRSMLPEGDISRGYNQQAVIEGIIKKASTKAIISKYNTILNSLESGIMTNIDKNALTKLVNLQLDKNIEWEIENFNTKGKSASKTTYSTGSAKAFVLEPDLESVSEAKLKIYELMN